MFGIMLVCHRKAFLRKDHMCSRLRYLHERMWRRARPPCAYRKANGISSFLVRLDQVQARRGSTGLVFINATVALAPSAFWRIDAIEVKLCWGPGLGRRSALWCVTGFVLGPLDDGVAGSSFFFLLGIRFFSPHGRPVARFNGSLHHGTSMMHLACNVLLFPSLPYLYLCTCTKP